MTEIEKNQIKRLWSSGMPMSRIRRMVAVPKTDFEKCVEEMRKNGEIGKIRNTSEKKVCEEFDNGERNVKAIAEKLGLAEKTVYIYLRWNGRKLGTKTRNYVHSNKTLEIAQELSDGELSYGEIAKKHRVTRQYIYKVKRKIEKGMLDYGKSN